MRFVQCYSKLTLFTKNHEIVRAEHYKKTSPSEDLSGTICFYSEVIVAHCKCVINISESTLTEA